MLDLPLPSQPQGITAPSPVPNYTAWWQRHMHVNNLPKVVTWKRNGQDSNLRPYESQVQRSNHYTTRPHMLLVTTDKPVLHYQGHCASYHSEWLFATTEEQTTNSAAYCQQSTCTDQAGVQSAVSSLGWWCCCLWLINTWQPQQTTVTFLWLQLTGGDGCSTLGTRSSRWMKSTRNTCHVSMMRLLSSSAATSSSSASYRKWSVADWLNYKYSLQCACL